MADIRILSHSKERCVRIFNLIFILLSILYSQHELIQIRSVDSDTVLQLVNNMTESISELSNKYELRSFSIDNSLSVYRVIKQEKFTHPYFNNENVSLQKDLHFLQGRKRTWFCGSYFGYGFHEDGLKSSIELIKNFKA